MSHVQKRDDRWQARYRGPDGRERTKRFDRKVDAENWLTTNGADIVRGSWVDPDRPNHTEVICRAMALGSERPSANDQGQVQVTAESPRQPDAW